MGWEPAQGGGRGRGAHFARAPHPDASSLPDPSLPPNLRRRPRAPRPVRVGDERRVRGRRLPRPVTALVAVAAAAVVVAVGWGLLSWQGMLARQRQGTGVALVLAIPGYGTGSSPIPLRVTGTTESGSPVSGVRIVSQAHGWLALHPGTYDLEAAGSPVTGSGGTFAVPKGAWHVVVTSQDAQVTAPNGTVSDRVSMTYRALGPEDVTEDDVAAIRGWMLDAGVQGVDAYTSAVETTRSGAGS